MSNEDNSLLNKIDKLNQHIDLTNFTRLYENASKQSTNSKKLIWLQKAADYLVKSVDEIGIAACRIGCSHCCNIAVSISETEALALSKLTSKRINKTPGNSVIAGDYVKSFDEIKAISSSDEDRYNQKPCPFLVNKKCSVYQSRPMACRLQISLADDDEPCKLEHGVREVPYLNIQQYQVAGLKILGLGQRYADIREWFPED